MTPSLWQRIRTFLIVTVLALLVWVWADLARPGELPMRDLRLKIELPGHLRLMSPQLPNGQALSINLTLSGPKRELNWLQDEMRAGTWSWQPVLRITEQPDKPYDLAEEINSMPFLRDRWLTAKNVSPRQLTVDVDEWVPVELPVEPNIDRGSLMGGQVRVSPARLRARVPGRFKKEAEGLKLRTYQVALGGLPADRQHDIEARILPVLRHPTRGDIPVDLPQAQSVRVAFTLKTVQPTEASLPNVPIRLAGPAEVLDHYKVDFSGATSEAAELSLLDIGGSKVAALSEVRVKGDPDDVAELLRDRPEFLAYIVVAQEDVKLAATTGTATLRRREVHFKLPKSVQRIKPVWISDVKLQKRPAPTDSPP